MMTILKGILEEQYFEQWKNWLSVLLWKETTLKVTGTISVVVLSV
jgi:hypothetical protein